MSDGSGRKTRVAVLGGGVGAMAAAAALTSPSNPRRDEFEVTVYQMGWRLGGKGASGRNAAYGQRIEEHGLHIWLGFYNNAFNAMRELYEEMGRPKGTPLATLEEAFKPQGFITAMDHSSGSWDRWNIYFPENGEKPGGHHELPDAWGYFNILLGWVKEFLGHEHHRKHHWLRDLWHGLTGHHDVEKAPSHTPLHKAHEMAGGLHSNAAHHEPRHHQLLVALIEEFRKALLESADLKSASGRRFFWICDATTACLIGLIEDGVILGHKTFKDLDEFELKEWLAKHGAHDSTLHSPTLRAYYDIAFAFEGGVTDYEHQNTGAGTAVQAMLRMCFTYKGAFMWKMQAGMGDTIFTPFYQVLKRRGVKFEFFHKVTEIEAADDKSISKIKIARQVDLTVDEYDPLVDVKDLLSWPSEPIYDQIKDGDKLREGGYNLESSWTDWPDAGRLELERGKHFDQVVLGISIAALKQLTPTLCDRDPSWKEMLEKVATVQTQAAQVWMSKNVTDLGWEPVKKPGQKEVERVVLDAYEDPLNSWADMSQLLALEDWPAPLDPLNVSYFCGPLPDEPLPPAPDPAFPKRQSERGKQDAVDWFKKHIGVLWPDATQSSDPNCLDWSLLVDPKNRQGEERFDSQYWRVNIDPTERYVLSLAGTAKYRKKSGESGFTNLVIAGDWTDNGLNVGCVEAATISGLMASQALCGYPQKIVGSE